METWCLTRKHPVRNRNVLHKKSKTRSDFSERVFYCLLALLQFLSLLCRRLLGENVYFLSFDKLLVNEEVVDCVRELSAFAHPVLDLVDLE